MGERNHGLFWWYLLFEFTLNMWTTTFTAAEFIGGVASDFKQALVPALVMCPLFALLTLGLLYTHSSFALFNRTTFESLSKQRIDYLKDLPPNGRSPFDHGPCVNVLIFCCACTRKAPVDWEQLFDSPLEGERAQRVRISEALGLGSSSLRTPLVGGGSASPPSRRGTGACDLCCRRNGVELV